MVWPHSILARSLYLLCYAKHHGEMYSAKSVRCSTFKNQKIWFSFCCCCLCFSPYQNPNGQNSQNSQKVFCFWFLFLLIHLILNSKNSKLIASMSFVSSSDENTKSQFYFSRVAFSNCIWCRIVCCGEMKKFSRFWCNSQSLVVVCGCTSITHCLCRTGSVSRALIELRFYSFDASRCSRKTINTRKLSHISSRMSTDVISRNTTS